MTVITARVVALLQGEPLRAITYGAIAVVLLVSRILVALGYWADAPSVDAVLLAVAAAVAAINETIRKFVYSPATVDAIRMGRALSPTPLPAGSEPS